MKDWRQSYDIREEPFDLVEFVPSDGVDLTREERESHLPGDFMIDTIHDGTCIPKIFMDAIQGTSHAHKRGLRKFDQSYTLERDWGADLVAHHLASELNKTGVQCFGHHRVTVARILMDFGRFPGNTPPKAEHLHRFAINYPFSHLLGYEHKKVLLEDYYDKISAQYERVITQRRFKIAIHTYDTYNEAGTQRPLMSIITRPIGYQTKSAMPVDFFDPMYPAVLSEYTADRRLTYRLSLMLEKEGVPIAHNYPYCLPDGSIEVRSQVWFFFDYLKRCFEQEYPETIENISYKKVWRMVLDTNLRSTESENLRSYLHMFRRAPRGEEKSFEDAAEAYRDIRRFMDRDDSRLVKEYRRSVQRPSSLGIEVRKDYVWEFADKACRYPIAPKEENAHKVARLLAKGIAIYLENDRLTYPSEFVEI
ncbi:MAG TPA: hypothetical protein DCE42_20930 [Myxococcales bacterium]|nr:hypothetical protein [Deltaproteobacteria bacterium]MBU48160.1 hypothetical protein [Deltaproteobacteria bacterium]HAA57244.1 hypothetical protein [Myxococcales bacterium]